VIFPKLEFTLVIFPIASVVTEPNPPEGLPNSLNHDRQIIGCVADNVLNLTALLHLLEDARSCFVNIGPDLQSEVTQGERIAGSDLFAQDPGRKCLVEMCPLSAGFSCSKAAMSCGRTKN
jgi:hypothetical protein